MKPEAPRRVASLIESEERFRLLVESVIDYAIFMLDPEGNIASWNSGAERIKGYKADEVIGRHFSLFYSAEDIHDRKPERELETAIREGRYEEEGWRIKKDGTRFWANVVLTPVYEDDGILKGFAKVTRDVSERLLLAESEERFQLLLQSVKDYAIFVLDPGGFISSWNVGAQRIKGYSASEIIGKHFSIFYTPEDLAAGKPAMELRVALAEGKYEEEGWRVRKDGTLFWANVLITALISRDGTPRGFAKITRDMTHRRQLEQELLEANRELEAFAYSVSHDLRAPLRGMMFSSKLLLEDFGDLLPEEATQLVNSQISEAANLATTIQDLLALARISRLEIDHETVDISRLFKELATNATRGKEVALTIDIAPNVRARGDRRLISIILQNLLENAIKFSPEGGTIRFGALQQGNQAVYFVSDEGVGFDMQYAHKIFLPFERLVKPTEFPGSGIGLASVQRAVTRHGGRIWVEALEGKGATFYFTLD